MNEYELLRSVLEEVVIDDPTIVDGRWREFKLTVKARRKKDEVIIKDGVISWEHRIK